MRYRKRPVEVEAVQYDGTNAQEIMQWMGGFGLFVSDRGLVISTLEGDMKVSPSDYVVKGIKGEFYPVKPDIFEETYEVVE